MKIIFFILIIIVEILLSGCNKNVNPLIPDIKDDSLNTVIIDNYLSGKVVDMVFFPIYNLSKAKIEIKSLSYKDSAFTDINGFFSLKNIPPNIYEILISKQDYDTLKNYIIIENGDSIFINYELKISYEFVDGRVATGFKDTVSVSSVFHLFDSLGLKIEKLNGFIYESKISTDSVGYVRNILASKSYLKVTNYNVSAIEGAIRIFCSFVNLDKNNFEDWLVTQNELKLFHKDKDGGTQRGYIEVPIGEEIRWARELRKYNIFRYIVLDYYIPGDLF